VGSRARSVHPVNELNWEVLQLLLLVAGLIGLNALLVAADFGLIKLHSARVDMMGTERAELPRSLQRLIADVNRTSGVLRLAINLVTMALGLVLVTPLGMLAVPLELPGAATVAVLLGFLLAVSIHFLLGELVPRALALKYPAAALRIGGALVHVLRVVLGPMAAACTGIAVRIFRLLRVEAPMETSILDVEVQMRVLLTGGEEVSPIMGRILKNTINLRKRVVQDILLPRNRIQYFDLTDTNATNIEIARKSGHTRFPLCEGDLDRCIGLIHIKDIFRYRGDWHQADLRRFRREILRFTLDDPLDVVLQKLLTQKRHMALALDEFGGTVGAVTLEDVLEELVGDIQDEFDKEELLIQELPDGEFQVDGLAPIHDVAEALGVEISNEEVSTFGGYITSELGRMPKENSTVTLGRLQIRITGANEKRVTSTRVRVLPPAEETTSD
jgi:CBS domain containing-hemolysin-like protein